MFVQRAIVRILGFVLLLVFFVPDATAQEVVRGQAPAKPVGYIVHWNGKSLERRNFKPYLVIRHSKVGDEFSVTTLEGDVLSGHSSHCPIWIDYRILPGQIEAIQNAVKSFDFSAAYLAKRLPQLEAKMAEYLQAKKEAERLAAERGMTLDRGLGETLMNAVALKVENSGKLVVQHRNGVVRDPVSFYSREQLLNFAQENPKLEIDPLFQEVLGSFVPNLMIAGRILKGVRPVHLNQEELVILHDGGVTRFKVGDLPAKALEQLEGSFERWAALLEKFDTGADQLEMEQRRLVAAVGAGGGVGKADGGLLRKVTRGALSGGAANAFIGMMEGKSGADVLDATVKGAAAGAVEELIDAATE